METIRDKAGEIVANYGRYIGDTSPVYNYHVRYNGLAFMAEDTDILAEKVAAYMRKLKPKER